MGAAGRLPKKAAKPTFRIDSALKPALCLAAERKHRFLANRVEVLIHGFCGQHGIAVPSQSTNPNNQD
ncbi:hypothetical protein BJL95_09785 [Methylomonas sp. LWB]|uniref:hypothetical protein n=1 Tax=Methylomonas sp. LWB TaxID=1905845 RepID=UPI0008D8F72A|nr:hypothetical protein [Methylomonas sp. LWB]OHX36078.1 hypothetical protein BJL95_09785 [Methylomonas sp. LWB]